MSASLRHPMHCSPPGYSIHEISQARILEWVAISFSKGSSPPRDRIQVLGPRGQSWPGLPCNNKRRTHGSQGFREQGKAGRRELASTAPAAQPAGPTLWRDLDGHWSPSVCVPSSLRLPQTRERDKETGSNATFLPFFSSIQIWEALNVRDQLIPPFMVGES